jgi:hypothetical protein
MSPSSRHAAVRIADFGMDTITLAGPLEAKLAAVRAAGFGQIMLAARDIVGHPQGVDAAVAVVQASGLRVTGFQVLRDFEGLSGHLHGYKVDIAKQMIAMAGALGAKVLLACSSTSQHATGELDAIARDLRKLAMLAVPHRNAAPGPLRRSAHVREAPRIIRRARAPCRGSRGTVMIARPRIGPMTTAMRRTRIALRCRSSGRRMQESSARSRSVRLAFARCLAEILATATGADRLACPPNGERLKEHPAQAAPRRATSLRTVPRRRPGWSAARHRRGQPRRPRVQRRTAPPHPRARGPVVAVMVVVVRREDAATGEGARVKGQG